MKLQLEMQHHVWGCLSPHLKTPQEPLGDANSYLSQPVRGVCDYLIGSLAIHGTQRNITKADTRTLSGETTDVDRNRSPESQTKLGLAC